MRRHCLSWLLMRGVVGWSYRVQHRNGIITDNLLKPRSPPPPRLLPLPLRVPSASVMMASSPEKEKAKETKGMENEQQERGERPPIVESPPPPPPLEPPEKPLPGDCCGSGCVRCVWDIYYEELETYNNSLSSNKRDQ